MMNEEQISIRQREKFRQLLLDRKISMRRMSMDLGLNESYFQQFVTYGRPMLVEGNILRQAAAYLGVSEQSLTPQSSWLREPRPGVAYDTTGYRGSVNRAAESNVVMIPIYDLGQAFESSGWAAARHQAGRMPFSLPMLQSITSASADQLVLLKVHGDAMAPTLVQGDYVLLNSQQSLVAGDGIYAIFHESQLLLKRFSVDPVRKQVSMSCDNPAYPAVREYSMIDIPVAGRALWVGKNL